MMRALYVDYSQPDNPQCEWRHCWSYGVETFRFSQEEIEKFLELAGANFYEMNLEWRGWLNHYACDKYTFLPE
ncbi:MAG: hypothetical protein ACYTEQ_01240 [Planctomycetota bacterium]|jgi:hypothetical protein